MCKVSFVTLDATAQAKWISASQVATYDLCPRKWGFYKLEGIKQPPNKYAERGSSIHALLAEWMEDGKPIDTATEYGRIAAPGVKFLPPPKTTQVEEKFTFSTDNAVYVGFWDLWEPPKEGLIRIHDHKTTSDFKWAKSGDDLKKDPQAIIYAAGGLALAQSLGFDAEELLTHLKWVYYRANANKPGAKVSQLFVIPDNTPTPEDGAAYIRQSELSASFQAIDEMAAKMVNHHRQGCKAVDLPYNTSGCRAYGGCPYRGSPCQLTTQEMIRGLMTQETLVEKMKRKLQEKSSTPSEAKTTETAKPASSEASPGAAERMRAAAKGPKVNPPAPVAEAGPNLRTLGAFDVSQGIVAARIFNHSDPNYVDSVGHLAVEIADAIIEASNK